MSDVIRLARHSHHYLVIFDEGKPIGLYHTKRLASPGQRIVLYARIVAAPARVATCRGISARSIMSRSGRPPTAPTSTSSPCLRIRPQTPRQGLDHPQERPRRHRMDPTPTPGLRPTRTNTFHQPEKLLAEEDEDEGDDRGICLAS